MSSEMTLNINARGSLDITATGNNRISLSVYADVDDILDQIDVEYIKDYLNLEERGVSEDYNE